MGHCYFLLMIAWTLHFPFGCFISFLFTLKGEREGRDEEKERERERECGKRYSNQHAHALNHSNSLLSQVVSGISLRVKSLMMST